jgi:hypothetical protein
MKVLRKALQTLPPPLALPHLLSGRTARLAAQYVTSCQVLGDQDRLGARFHGIEATSCARAAGGPASITCQGRVLGWGCNHLTHNAAGKRATPLGLCLAQTHNN